MLLLLNGHMQFEPSEPTLTLGSIIIPEGRVDDGILIKSFGSLWLELAERLGEDWSQAFQISSREWEEMIAGAFNKGGYSVTLTPQSGDHGRDVIAVKRGVGSIRILGSMKAYKPGHLVTKEEVHALMGVVGLDPNASKGILTTTSDFAPRILDDPRLAQAVPHRIELMNGAKLQQWLKDLTDKN